MCSLFLPWLSVGLGLQVASLHIWVSGDVGAWEKGQPGSCDTSLFVRCRNIRNCYPVDLISLDLLLEEKALPSAVAVMQVRGVGAAPSLLKLLEVVREETDLGRGCDMVLLGAVGFYYCCFFK